MFETALTAIKASIMAAIMNTFGLYTGAALISAVAALARIAYSPENPSIKLFGRFFAMSLGLTMIMVHIGNLRGWDNQTVIVVSGVAAFLCREVFDLVMHSKNQIIKQIIGRIKL